MKSIPYGHQSIDLRDAQEVLSALMSDWITQGPRIQKFEEALSAYTGARYAVCVSSGTAALHLAALAAGICKGDEVITSPFTFAASANCALYCGGKPVFSDIEQATFNMDPLELSRNITCKTRAIIPVHFAGHPCDMKKISSVARKHGLVVIEDAAHALGADYSGKKTGSCAYSDMAIFSFHPVKAITTGEGGAVVTNDKKLYKKLLTLRTHGIAKEGLGKSGEGAWYYEMHSLGFNYRITDIQAALGLSQLRKIDRFVAKRRAIALAYSSAFKENFCFDIPVEENYARSAYHLYPVRLKNGLERRRKDVFTKCQDKGIGVQVHYIPVYLHPYYKALGYKQGLCPKAEFAYNTEISLPIYPTLSKSQVSYVINEFSKICETLCD